MKISAELERQITALADGIEKDGTFEQVSGLFSYSTKGFDSTEGNAIVTKTGRDTRQLAVHNPSGGLEAFWARISPDSSVDIFAIVREKKTPLFRRPTGEPKWINNPRPTRRNKKFVEKLAAETQPQVSALRR